MKKFLTVIFSLLIFVPCVFGQISFSTGDIKEIGLIGRYYEKSVGSWMFTTTKTRGCSADVSDEFSRIMGIDRYFSSWGEKRDRFNPNIYIVCEDITVYIEFGESSISIVYPDEHRSSDYRLSEEGYDELLRFCIGLFPEDGALRGYIK